MGAQLKGRRADAIIGIGPAIVGGAAGRLDLGDAAAGIAAIGQLLQRAAAGGGGQPGQPQA